MDKFSPRRRVPIPLDDPEWQSWLTAIIDDRARQQIDSYHRVVMAQRPESSARRELLDALREVQEACATLERRLDLLSDRHDQLDDRFTEVLATRVAGGGHGEATARHVEHQQIADRYQAFVEQDVLSAARAIVPPSRRRWRDSPPAEQRTVARRVAAISDALFSGPVLDVERLQFELTDAPSVWLGRLAATGATLRAVADGAAPRAHWDFVATPGAPADPARQRVWGTDPPDAPVVFVVAPAYVVGDRVYAPQRVATAEHSN